MKDTAARNGHDDDDDESLTKGCCQTNCQTVDKTRLFAENVDKDKDRFNFDVFVVNRDDLGFIIGQLTRILNVFPIRHIFYNSRPYIKCVPVLELKALYYRR